MGEEQGVLALNMGLLDDPRFRFREYGAYTETSAATKRYNCIAFAVGDTHRKWWPDPMHTAYWPQAAPRETSIEAFIVAFQQLGYSPCENPEYEPGYEKVALFADASRPTHAARQLTKGSHEGRWCSKLGDGIDVAHALEAVTGPLYGSVVALLKRQVAPEEEAPT